MDQKRGQGYSRPPLARMMRLHEWLMANRHPNCRKIAEEFEVSPKTVQRDVNFMRDQMGLPIEYDKARFGFCYTRTVVGFPSVDKSVKKRARNPWSESPPPAIGEHPPLSAPAPDRGLAVRIRFDAESSGTVRARTWHKTQVLHRLQDGGVDLALHARNEWEIARWVLSWGGHAWVIEPPQLRKKVREMAAQVGAKH